MMMQYIILLQYIVFVKMIPEIIKIKIPPAA